MNSKEEIRSIVGMQKDCRNDLSVQGAPRLVLINILVGLAIYITGWLSVWLVKGQPHALAPIWPAAGIALAAVILAGPWVWPGILLPLWVSCLASGEHGAFAFLAPAGTTALIIGASLLLHRAHWDPRLSSTRDVLLLLGMGGLLPMMAAGFWTAWLLLVTQTMPLSALLPVGWLYGCANTAGTIVIAPVILLAAQGRFHWSDSKELLRSLPPLLFCIIAAWLAFRGVPAASKASTVSALVYLPFPFLVWAALSRGLPSAALALLGIVAVGVAYTSRGLGPFASTSLLSEVWQFQVYIAILSSTGLLLGAGSEAQKRERALREEALIREGELERIKAQIHPHFLFNCLNAIHSLIGSSPSEARSGILSLSRLLRTSLDSARESRIPLAKEMEMISDYLDLQKMRFEEGLETEIQMDGSAADFPVAPMIIQPLVENSVKHGVRDGVGSVRISATVSGDWLSVSITNPAPIDCNADVWKEGVGLASVRARLRESWGKRAELNFAVLTTGSITASLRIPKT